MQEVGADSDSNSDSNSEWSVDLDNNFDIENDNENHIEDGDYQLIEDNADFIAGGGEDQDVNNVPMDSDSENEEPTNFPLSHPGLNRILTFNEERTVKDGVLLQLSLAVRHKLTYECLIQSF